MQTVQVLEFRQKQTKLKKEKMDKNNEQICLNMHKTSASKTVAAKDGRCAYRKNAQTNA